VEDRRLARFSLALLGLALNGAGVYAYYRIGSYVYVGTYEGVHLHWWEPYGPAVAVSVVAVLAGLLIYAVSRRPTRRVVLASSVLALAVVLGIVGVGLRYYETAHLYVLRISTITDSYILQVEAARALIQGVNPYTVSYREALASKLPPDLYTWVYSGDPPYTVDDIVGFVDRFDYLAPAALYYVPALLLGIPPYMWDALVTTVGLTLVYRRLPGHTRDTLIALLTVGLFIYIAPVISKTTLAGWVIPLTVAVAYLDRPWIAGPLIAWAGTYRIYPAFFILFLLLAAQKEGLPAKRLIASAIIAGALLNLPFILWDPKTYIEAFLIPYRLNLNPLDMGPGLSSLGHIGVYLGKEAHTLLVLLLTGAGLAVSWKWYPRLKHAIFVFPALAMFAYYRPSYVYYVFFPWLGLLAYLAGHIRYLDEPPGSIRERDALRIAGLVLGASIAGGLEVIELVPTTMLHRIIVIGVAMAAPLVVAVTARPVKPRLLAASTRRQTLLFALLVLTVAIAGGTASGLYYIVYDLEAARTALEHAAQGYAVPLQVKAIVPVWNGLEAPVTALAGAPAYTPPRLDPLPSLLVGLLGASSASTVAVILPIIVALATGVALYGRHGLLPLIAVAGSPSLFLGPHGLGVQEVLLIAGLLALALAVMIPERGPKAVLTLLGALVAALSAPLGALAAGVAIAVMAGRRLWTLLAVAAGLVYSLGSLHSGLGYVQSYVYSMFCLGLACPLPALIGFAGGIADLVAGPLLGASSVGPGILGLHYCSLHAVAALIFGGLAWALARGTRALRGCGGGRRGC